MFRATVNADSSKPSYPVFFDSLNNNFVHNFPICAGNLHWKSIRRSVSQFLRLGPNFRSCRQFCHTCSLHPRDSDYGMLCNLPIKVTEVGKGITYRDPRYRIGSSALDKNPDWPCGRHKIQGSPFTQTFTTLFLYILCLWRRPGAKLSSAMNPCKGQTSVCNICNTNVVQFFFRACLTTCDMQNV